MHTQERGQTLIETMIGIFILTMGITAAVGLASYALHSTSGVTKQLIGTGLAREGLEAYRNMRDTNWLQTATPDTNCYNFSSPSANNATCYRNWMTAFYTLNPGGANCCVLNANTIATDSQLYWQLSDPGSAATRYLLYFDPTAATGTFYTTQAGTGRVPSDYHRQIIVTPDSTGSYYSQTGVGPRLQVVSRVWWTDKNCPASDTFPVSKKCSVELSTYLTNWKNY